MASIMHDSSTWPPLPAVMDARSTAAAVSSPWLCFKTSNKTPSPYTPAATRTCRVHTVWHEAEINGAVGLQEASPAVCSAQERAQ